MKYACEVVAIENEGWQRWSGAALYKVTLAAVGEHDNRVSEIHVDERTAKALRIGRRVTLGLVLR